MSLYWSLVELVVHYKSVGLPLYRDYLSSRANFWQNSQVFRGKLIYFKGIADDTILFVRRHLDSTFLRLRITSSVTAFFGTWWITSCLELMHIYNKPERQRTQFGSSFVPLKGSHSDRNSESPWDSWKRLFKMRLIAYYLSSTSESSLAELVSWISESGRIPCREYGEKNCFPFNFCMAAATINRINKRPFLSKYEFRSNVLTNNFKLR